MTATLETRKLSVVEYLAELEDESILLQIENLLKPKVDFWEELPDRHKFLVRQGEKDLNAGQRISFSDFLTQRRSKV